MAAVPPLQTTHLGGQPIDIFPLSIISLCVLLSVFQIKHPCHPLPAASRHPAPTHCHWLTAMSPFSDKLFWSETRDESKDLSDEAVRPFAGCVL